MDYLDTVIQSVLHPHAPSEGGWGLGDATLRFFFLVGVSAALLPFVALADVVVARRFKKPYYALHVIVNACITVAAAPSAVQALAHPAKSNTCDGYTAACGSMLPACLSLAIHVYHPLAFKLVALDWQHHIPV